MADRAQVTSVEAIESFRSSLILFLSKARPALEEVSSDVLRMRLWLQHDQRARWENELKQRSRNLERAQAELFGSRLSKIQTATAAQQMAVIRARRAVQEAESKLRVLRKWDRELENRAQPLLKQVDSLHGYLTAQMPKAVAELSRIVQTLDAYADLAPERAPGTAKAVPSAEERPPRPGSDGAEDGGSE